MRFDFDAVFQFFTLIRGPSPSWKWAYFVENEIMHLTMQKFWEKRMVETTKNASERIKPG